MENTNKINTPTVMPQFISIKEVIKYTALSRATIYRMLDEESPSYYPTFPKKIQLSQARVVWVATEIAEWINAKIAQREVA